MPSHPYMLHTKRRQRSFKPSPSYTRRSTPGVCKIFVKNDESYFFVDIELLKRMCYNDLTVTKADTIKQREI